MSAEEQRHNRLARFQVGEWLVEPSRNRLSRGQAEVAVEPKVMEVLVVLARQAGETVTKDDFFETVWNGMVVTEDVLSRCISELRKNLGDDSRDPRYIETIRKTGYRLIAPVSEPETAPRPGGTARSVQNWSETGRPGASTATSTEASAGFWTWLTSKWWRWLSVILVLTGAAVYVVWRIADKRSIAVEPVTIPFTSGPGLEIHPAFSPDGKRIAFASREDRRSDFDMYLKQEGSDEQLLLAESPADEHYPAWSPDGLFLAFARSWTDSSAVYVVPSLGGQDRLVGQFGSRTIGGISWSPGGEELVVSAQTDRFGAFNLFLLPVDSVGVKQITDPPDYGYGDVAPAISPDGRHVAFTRGVTRDLQDLFVYELATSDLQQITSDSVSIRGLTWMPDGKSIVFSSLRDGRSGLWRVSIPDGPVEIVAPASPGRTYEDPSITSDGARLSYVDKSANVNIWRVFKPPGFVSFRARPAVFSTYFDAYPDVSPDGDKLAFTSSQSGKHEIWMSAADGTNQIRLTSLEGGAIAPKWSPDGDEVAFQWRKKGQADVYVVSAQGGAPERITKSTSEDTFPNWSQNGDWIYFSSNRTGRWEMWRISRVDGRLEQVTRTGGRFGMESHDGSSIYFVRPDTVGIWSREIESTDDPKLIYDQLDPRDWGNWIAARSGIYFVERKSYSPALSFYFFQSGRIAHVITLGNIPDHPALASAKDFSWFAYTQVDDEGGDIMIVENFQ